MTTAPATTPRTGARPRTRTAARDPVLVVGLALVALVALALRGIGLTAHLPQLVEPDEPTTVTRAAAALDGELVPPAWDWPPASAYLLAGVAAAASPAAPALVDDDPADLYVLGRWLTLATAIAVVLLTGVLGAAVARDRAGRRLVGIGAAAAVAVSYLSVRLGRMVHPEHLQAAFVLGAVIVAARLPALRRWRTWVGVAGVLVGLAAATKYVGAVAALPVAVAAWQRAASARDRLAGASALAAGAVAGFTLGTLGTFLRFGHFVDGLAWQFRHQAGGHLGYEADLGGWWFHLTTSLPGNFGWLVTVLGLAGAVVAFTPAGRRLRPAAVAVAPLLALAAVTRIRFPHYVLIDVPLLAVLALGAVDVGRRRAPDAWRRPVAALATTAIALSLVPTVLNDVRLLRAQRSPDTRELALEALDGLPAGVPVWAEAYTLTAAPTGVRPWSADDASVLDCGCYLLLSSYQDERYRRRPDLYPDEVALREEIADAGRVAAVVEPAVDLSYRWDLLPGWGVERVPLRGEVGPTGPTVTVVDLRGAG